MQSLLRTAVTSTMPRLAPFIILVLILISQMSSGENNSLVDTAKSSYTTRKMNARKVFMEIALDYDDGGANNRHDPRRGRPGIGSRAP